MFRRSAVLLLFLFLALNVNASPLPPLRQYLSIRGAGTSGLSPDGQTLTFLTGVTGTVQVWKIPAAGGAPVQLTFFKSSVRNAVWSPVRNELIVVADNDGNEQFQLYKLTIDDGRVIPLTANPKVRYSFGGWSKDGNSIYFASNERNSRFFDCYLMDLKSGKTYLVFQKDAVLDAVALSPDGKTLAALENISNVSSNLYFVDLTTGQAKLATPHQGEAVYYVIDFTRDGASLLLETNQNDPNGSAREFINLGRLDVATGTLHYLENVRADGEGGMLSPDGTILAYAHNRDGYKELELLDPQNGKRLSLPKLPRGLITPDSFSRSGKLSISINLPTRNSDVWLLDLSKRKLSQVTQSSLSGINPRTFTEPKLIRFKSFDGREVPAFLYIPRGQSKEGSHPVILSVHGGPEGQERPNFSPLYQYFLSRGYAVMAPNIRGSSGYGKQYLDLDNGPKRWDALKDLSAAAEFIKAQPGLDSSRITIFGGSYGGFTVLAMLTHYPKLFAAGVDLFGIADFKTFLKNTAPFRRPLRISEYGDPERDSAFLDAISPALHADQISSPLMVIQGSNDPRVPETESQQIVTLLRQRGRVVKYLLFSDEGHGLSKLTNRIRAYEEMIIFLDENVRSKKP